MAFVWYPKLIQTYLIFYSPSMTFHEISLTAFDSTEHTARTNTKQTKKCTEETSKKFWKKNNAAFPLIDFVWVHRK